MMRESKRPKKTRQIGEKLESVHSGPCDKKEVERSTNEKPVRVRFVLPEENFEQADNTTSKELIALPTLPSICEFTMFSSDRMATKPEKKAPHAGLLTKLPPMHANNSKINAKADGLATNKKLVTNKGPVTCTKQDIRMEINGKLPEDYRDPTYKETKKRIWDWLKQSEEHQPAYLRRAKAFGKTVRVDTTDTQYQTFSQRKTLTQRIGL